MSQKWYSTKRVQRDDRTEAPVLWIYKMFLRCRVSTNFFTEFSFDNKTETLPYI